MRVVDLEVRICWTARPKTRYQDWRQADWFAEAPYRPAAVGSSCLGGLMLQGNYPWLMSRQVRRRYIAELELNCYLLADWCLVDCRLQMGEMLLLG